MLNGNGSASLRRMSKALADFIHKRGGFLVMPARRAESEARSSFSIPSCPTSWNI